MLRALLTVPVISLNLSDSRILASFRWAVGIQNIHVIRMLLETPGADIRVKDWKERAFLFLI